MHFYPRPPRGGRLSSVIPSACPGTFLSTPSARRATRFTIQTSFLVANISIHALREEGDSIGRLPHRHNRNFYPRPPRGGRHGDSTAHPAFLVFLSTPSARRATRKSWKSISAPCNFYPRPPQGGRLMEIRHQFGCWEFLSTPSARRATHPVTPDLSRAKNFYPRPPQGGRHSNTTAVSDAYKFLSTPSARRATSTASCCALPSRPFLSTPSARRATAQAAKDAKHPQHFYPRPPQGGRPPVISPTMSMLSKFLSTPSARRATG